jgi:hypothetical protein
MERKQNVVVVKAKRQTKRPSKQNKGSQRPITSVTGLSAHDALRFAQPLFSPRFKKNLFYYEDGLNRTSTTGVTNSYFFSANGIYDPNVTGTGHQPMGFDQMMSMYLQYTVLSAKLTLNFQNWSAANAYCGVILYLNPDTTQNDHSLLIENGLAVWKQVYPINIYGSLGILNLDCNIPAYFARNTNKRELVDDVTLSGTAAANPTEQVYFGICPFDPAGSATVQMIFNVTIEYEVIFWEPRKLTQS